MDSFNIRIIDSNFNLLGELNPEYFFIHEVFNSHGQFEMKINRHKKYTEKIQKDCIVFLDSENAAIVEYKEIGLNEAGKASEDWIVKGYTIESILRYRTILPGQNISADAETIIKHFIEKNITAPDDLGRRIDIVEIAPNQNRGIALSWDGSKKNLADEVKKILAAAGLGLKAVMDFEKKKIVFDVVEGRDLTHNQEANNPVLFSVDFSNIQSNNYVESKLDYKNVVYIEGKTETKTIGEASGLQRKEIYFTSEDAETEEQFTTVGLQKLQEYEEVRSFEGEILDQGAFRYKKDWNLGDIVTLQNKEWNVTVDTRITELKKTYSEGGLFIDANFGNKVPTLLDQIKREIRK